MFVNVVPFIFFILYFWLLAQIDVFSIGLSRGNRNTLMIFSLCLLVVFAGGRWSSLEAGYDVGIFDYSTYKNIYLQNISILHFWSEYVASDIEIKAIEPGYIFYSSLCHIFLGDNYNLYLLFTNLLLIILLYKCLKRNDIKYCYFFLFFFFASRLYFQYNFMLLRQTIAMFILWTWGFPSLIKARYIHYVFIVIIASLFHITALIGLLAFVFNRSLNIKYLVVSTFVFVVIGVVGNNLILENILEFSLSIFDLGALGEKLGKYLLEEDTRPLNILNFVEAVPFFYIASKYKCELLKTASGRFYYNMFYVFILLLAITMNFGFLTRMCQYFVFSYFFLLSFYFGNETSLIRRKRLFSLLSCYLLIYSIRYIFMWFYALDYYSFFLFKI